MNRYLDEFILKLHPYWVAIPPRGKILGAIISTLVVFVAGWLIGLILFGWWLTPVQWEYPQDFSSLDSNHKVMLVLATSDLYAYSQNKVVAQSLLGSWGGDNMACNLAMQTEDPAQRARLVGVAYGVNGVGCVPYKD